MSASPFGHWKIQRTLLSRPPAATGVAMALLSVLALTAGFALYHQDVAGLADLLAATPEQVFGRHEYWRAWTTIAVHADLEHLLSNLGYFAGLAFLLSGYYGGWAFPVVSILVGGLANLLALASYPAETQLVGASGVVYLMAGLWLTLYACAERATPLARRIGNCLAFTLVLLVPQKLEPQVSYRTHFIGLALGILAGAAFFYFKRVKIRAAEVVAWVPPELPESGPGEAWEEPYCAEEAAPAAAYPGGLCPR